MDSSTPGFPVLHYLPEFIQIHVHWVSDAILTSHPLPPSSPFAFSYCQHQSLFHWVSSSLTTKVLELQDQSLQYIFRIGFFLVLTVGSPCSLRNSQVSSPAPRLNSIISSVLSLLYDPTLTSVHDYWKNHSFDYTNICWQSDFSAF